MLSGIAALPSAPLLAPGVVPAVPPEAAAVADAVTATVHGLPEADVAVVVTAGSVGVDRHARIDLSSLGRPGVRHVWPVPAGERDRLAAATDMPLRSASHLGIDAACLTLHLGGRWPVVAMRVPATGTVAGLMATAHALVDWSRNGARSVLLVAASDGAAGLAPRAPKAFVEGTAVWQERFVAAVAAAAVDDVAALGPDEALRVGARGWAPTLVLLAVAAEAGLRPALRSHGAPRGIGYVVAASP